MRVVYKYQPKVPPALTKDAAALIEFDNSFRPYAITADSIVIPIKNIVAITN